MGLIYVTSCLVLCAWAVTARAVEEEKKSYHKTSYHQETYVFHGEYKGKCGEDGLYWRDHTSLVICTHGTAFVQPCAPGTRNAPKRFEHGHSYGKQDFCNVNLVDYGYAATYRQAHPDKPKVEVYHSGYEAGYHSADVKVDHHQEQGKNDRYHGNDYYGDDKKHVANSKEHQQYGKGGYRADSHEQHHGDAYGKNDQYHADAYKVKDQYHADAYKVKDQYHADAYKVKDQYHADAYKVKDQYHADAYPVKDQYHANNAYYGNEQPHHGDAYGKKDQYHADAYQVKDQYHGNAYHGNNQYHAGDAYHEQHGEHSKQSYGHHDRVEYGPSYGYQQQPHHNAGSREYDRGYRP